MRSLRSVISIDIRAKEDVEPFDLSKPQTGAANRSRRGQTGCVSACSSQWPELGRSERFNEFGWLFDAKPKVILDELFDCRDTYMEAASRTRELKMLEKQRRLVEELKANRSQPSLDERIIKDTAPSNRKWISWNV